MTKKKVRLSRMLWFKKKGPSKKEVTANLLKELGQINVQSQSTETFQQLIKEIVQGGYLYITVQTTGFAVTSYIPRDEFVKFTVLIQQLLAGSAPPPPAEEAYQADKAKAVGPGYG